MKVSELFEEKKPASVDMTGKKHEGCGGKFQEASQYDDLDGVLHCTKCNKEIKRHANPVTEGMFVVKSKDGVEKRFKSADSADAKAWQNNNAKKKTELEPSARELDQKAAQYLWHVLSTTDGWGELDWVDIVSLKIIPQIWKNASNDQYGEKFADAVRDAKAKDGSWEDFRKYLNAAVRWGAKAKNFGDWADEMSTIYKDES